MLGIGAAMMKSPVVLVAVALTAAALLELAEAPQPAVSVVSATALTTRVAAGMPWCLVNLAENMRPSSNIATRC